MKIYANQKTVCVYNSIAANNSFDIINKECIYRASQNLTYNEFKIFLYIFINQDKLEFALSPTDIANKMGANKREIQKSVNGLIDKGYLVHNQGNQYIFKEEV